MECEDAGPLSSIPCEGEVKLEICPFDDDVNNKTTYVWLCRRHLHERAMDI